MLCPACEREYLAGTTCPVHGIDLVESRDWDTATARHDALDGVITAETVAVRAMPQIAQVGSVIGGRYQLEQLIGAGGVGAVYRARQLDVPRHVAVKLLLPEFAGAANISARFEREASIISRLKHPNILRLFDSGDMGGGAFYIATELLEGRSLEHVIKDGPVEPRRLVRVMMQVALALEEAHAAGVVHRDLKPANVFLEHEGTRDGRESAKVLDFGLAKLITEPAKLDDPARTATGNVVGTPQYMSPEQACGLPIDGRADLYSLGVIAYYSLSGALPFDGSAATVMTKHVFQPPPDLRSHPASANIHHELVAMIARLMQKNAVDRYASATELRIELERVEPLLAQPYEPAPEDSTQLSVPRDDGDATVPMEPIAMEPIAPAAPVATVVPVVPVFEPIEPIETLETFEPPAVVRPPNRVAWAAIAAAIAIVLAFVIHELT